MLSDTVYVVEIKNAEESKRLMHKSSTMIIHLAGVVTSVKGVRQWTNV